MKRIIKMTSSIILQNKWVYKKDSINIRKNLELEQLGYCAYTEERLSATYARDIEHFNPKLKNTNEDGYYNWYAVSHKWNNIKSEKWDKYQPCLSPTDADVETVFEFDNGFYDYNPADTRADNLAQLIGLNDIELVKERQAYIAMLKDLQNEGIDLERHLKKHTCNIRFRTAVEAVFGIAL